jgi:hypothetical protein
MKTKEEIEQLADEFTTRDHAHYFYRGRDAYIKAYTQCQEDIVEKYTEQDMIKFAFDTYYQEDMAKKYTEEDIMKAIVFGYRQNSNNGHIDNEEERDFINSLNKQD